MKKYRIKNEILISFKFLFDMITNFRGSAHTNSRTTEFRFYKTFKLPQCIIFFIFHIYTHSQTCIHQLAINIIPFYFKKPHLPKFFELYYFNIYHSCSALNSSHSIYTRIITKLNISCTHRTHRLTLNRIPFF